MGTRCLTVVQDQGKDVMVLYRQFDGYPDGHGQELADFLKPMTIGNGIVNRAAIGSYANGFGCLAAQIVARFKTEVGGFYLYPCGTRDCGEEFTYVVTVKDGKPWIAIHEGTVTAFGMPGRIKSDDMPCIWEGFAADFDAKKIQAAHQLEALRRVLPLVESLVLDGEPYFEEQEFARDTIAKEEGRL